MKRKSKRESVGSAGSAGFNPLCCTVSQLCTGMDAQLVLDMFAVRFDGLDAQTQVIGNLAGAPSLTDQPKHLQFAVAEHVKRRVCFQCLCPVTNFAESRSRSLSLIYVSPAKIWRTAIKTVSSSCCLVI